MEREITSDPDTVRVWAKENDVVPVRYGAAGDESAEVMLVAEAQRGEKHERVDWDEFFDALERHDKAVAAHGRGDQRTVEIVDRHEAVRDTSLSTDDLEESLMSGETVSTEVTQTRVVEQTVVEHADLESELVDTRQLEESIVEAELVSREVLDCNVTDAAGRDEESRVDFDMFRVGARSSGDLGLDVEVEVSEQWSVVTEAVEQATIETRVVDSEITESDTTETETETTDAEVGIDDVEQTILESELLESRAVDADSIDEKSISSDYTEGDAVVTEVVERKTVDEDVTVERRLEGTIGDAETTNVRSTNREVVDSEMVEADEYEVGEAETTGEPVIDREGTTSTDAERGETATTSETASDVRVTPHEKDKGKKAIDETGDELGIVDGVEGGTLYVNPHPSLTEKIMAKLGWGDSDEDSYPVHGDHIVEITDDHVLLSPD